LRAWGAQPVETSLGIRLFPSVAASRFAGPIDTLLVSGGSGQARTNPALLKWLRIQGRKARRCSLETMDTLRRAFVRRFGVTPQRYRERFC
jgi:transcriptional regulator GlxA family with amidase domain